MKLIGVYGSRQAAEEAVNRLRIQPGFRDFPRIIDSLVDQTTDGFYVEEYEIGKDHWTEGFSTLVPIRVEVLGDRERLECLHAEWMPGDVYRLIEAEGDPPSDRLAFKYGQIVRCERRTFNGFPGCLVAVEIAAEAG